MLYLMIDNEKIIEEDSYEVDINDVLSNSSGDTEAGTKQYDYVRKNVHEFNLSYTVTDKWLVKFANMRSKDTLNVSFFNELTGTYEEILMKMKDFKSSKVLSTKKRNVWTVSFKLEEI